MKIGILTLPLHTNYGGILQAWALQTVLERMGHEVEVIDKSRYRYLPWYKKPFVYSVRIIKKLLGIKTEGLHYESWWNNCLTRDVVTLQYTQQFIEKHIHLRPIKSFKEIAKSDYDGYVVGSDQIWRQKYSKLQLNDVFAPFLDFAKSWDVKRISYAASFGTDEWEYSNTETRVIKKLLSKFDAVSVREVSGKDLCLNFLGYKNAVHLIDPTMLLDKEDYMPLFEGKSKTSSGKLMCYVLDQSDEMKQFIQIFSQKTALKPFNANSKVDDWNAPIEERIQPPVEQWLQGFYDADYVLTDSFHACVFSILFKKPFYVLGNEKRGLARFDSLLSMFDLQDRLVTDCSMPITPTPIDYQHVYDILNNKRKLSFDFLMSNL